MTKSKNEIVINATLDEVRKGIPKKLPEVQIKENITPTVKGAVVVEFEKPDSRLCPLTSGKTKRYKILELGLKGAYDNMFNTENNDYKEKLQSTAFWREAKKDIGVGYVIEDHGAKGKFLYYILPAGVTEIPLRAKVEKKKAEPKVAKPAAPLAKPTVAAPKPVAKK